MSFNMSFDNTAEAMTSRSNLKGLSLSLLLLLLIFIILSPKVKYDMLSVLSSVLIAFGGERTTSPGRNEKGANRRYLTTQQLPPFLKARTALYLSGLSIYAGYLVLLSGDVSLNPGPTNCAVCLKGIRARQPRLPCHLCERIFHLKCLGAEFELSRCCQFCAVRSTTEGDSEDDSDVPSNSSKFREFAKLRGLKLIHQNIQSLGSKINHLRLLVRELKSEIHLLTLSETWIKEGASDGEFEIPGYRLFRKDRKGNHGGVAVYAREDMSVTRRDYLEVTSAEVLWLESTLPKSRSFLVGTVYRPDWTSNYYDGDFMVKLNYMLDSVSAQGQEVILCGDFNCCLLSSKRNDPDCRQLKSIFSCLDFKQLITKPTRIIKDSKSLVDLIAVNCPMNIRDSGVISSHLSDHELVYCVRKLYWKWAPAQTKTFRNYANYDSRKFCEDLKGFDWNSVLTPNGQAVTGVDDLWNGFKSAFMCIADSHAPVIQKRVRSVDNCPWLNKEI
ncbi:uncharacterized protein LOC5512908 isoform X1 [Nematostella vectensis]|uniref:uncharacterized protein LOC5512908 isoform X1 n=1 Tax=Nematostella vectensis TaxID=45351 RepID=UPI0020775E13|nr:uncharacterized protein LOC5512908 isoform X1 [Nematostella vectensis]XP_048582993.1 uncharacterized protein LOC5512908 isoform X1 [Nematostella vectensis]